MICMQVDVSRQQIDDHLVLKCYLVDPRKLDDPLMDLMAVVLLYFKHIPAHGSINSSGATLEPSILSVEP